MNLCQFATIGYIFDCNMICVWLQPVIVKPTIKNSVSLWLQNLLVCDCNLVSLWLQPSEWTCDYLQPLVNEPMTVCNHLLYVIAHMVVCVIATFDMKPTNLNFCLVCDCNLIPLWLQPSQCLPTSAKNKKSMSICIVVGVIAN
jgi:hypothetical protein